ncbi:MAG TPA: rhodanese-like domain-containing protein [Streptosporangiaceae bacterium]
MRQRPLIVADELAATLRSARPPTVLDVRWTHGIGSNESEYLRGHVPGASFVDLDAELCGPADDSGKRPIPQPDTFTTAMQRHGVCSSRPVVVYDADDSSAAARAWWLLRYFGHSDVSVLDGGYSAWSRCSDAVKTGHLRFGKYGDFVAVPGGMPVCDAEGAAALARSGILLDARRRELYLGGIKSGDRAGGHIPGALSAPTFEYSNPDGTFRSTDALIGLLKMYGVSRESDAPIGVYCGTGISATHTVLALAKIGLTVALYPGSWSHWLADPTRPIARGSEPG